MSVNTPFPDIIYYQYCRNLHIRRYSPQTCRCIQSSNNCPRASTKSYPIISMQKQYQTKENRLGNIIEHKTRGKHQLGPDIQRSLSVSSLDQLIAARNPFPDARNISSNPRANNEEQKGDLENG